MEDEEQTVLLKANYVISAFGSGLTDTEGKTMDLCIMSGVAKPSSRTRVRPKSTYCTNIPIATPLWRYTWTFMESLVAFQS